MQPRDTFEHSGAPETSFHAATHELRCRTDIQRSQAVEDRRPVHHGRGPPRGYPHGDPQEDPCRRCSGRGGGEVGRLSEGPRLMRASERCVLC